VQPAPLRCVRRQAPQGRTLRWLRHRVLAARCGVASSLLRVYRARAVVCRRASGSCSRVWHGVLCAHVFVHENVPVYECAYECERPRVVPAAFCLPAGLAPFVPLYQHGLMHGSEDVRELSATALGELALYSSSEALRPYLTKITGPLIRIVGDKFNARVRASVLQCECAGKGRDNTPVCVCVCCAGQERDSVVACDHHRQGRHLAATVPAAAAADLRQVAERQQQGLSALPVALVPRIPLSFIVAVLLRIALWCC
jgi:hypothetical protein